MLKMYGYLKYFWWQSILAVTFIIIRISADLSLPDFMSRIVDEGIIGQDQSLVFSLGIQMLGVAAIVVIFFIGSSFLASYIGSAAGNRIRSDLFTKIESFSLVEFDHFTSSSLITRSTQDVAQIQQILTMSFRIMLAAPLNGIIGLIKAFSLNLQMSFVFAITLPVMSLMVFIIFSLTNPRFAIVQKLTDQLNRLARESLTGIRVIRAFNAQEQQAKKFEKVNQEVLTNNISLMRILGLMDPLINLGMSFTIIAILWVGSSLIQDQSLQIGHMMAFVQYVTLVLQAFMMLTGIFMMWPRAVVSAQRIEEVLNTKISIQDPLVEEKASAHLQGEVRFEHVSFRYPFAQENVLEDISFTAMPGTTTAFIGSTGSGKSTLINLIPRLYDVSEGTIYVDGCDLRKMSQNKLRKKIGYVPQKGLLLSGTIEDSIRFGDSKVSPESLQEILEIAQAKQFVAEKEGGLNFKLAQGATNVSGGQKQRLSIARALLRKPEILIFDDSFSALDTKTDAALRQALHQKTQGLTVFIVGQRVSTILHADQIIVLEQGKIEGMGTHQELLKSSKVYAEIAASQLTAEELV